MAKLTMKAIQDNAKSQIFANVLEMATEQDGVQFGDYELALPVQVETSENEKQLVWVTVTLTAKNWKDTKQANAFDPTEKREEWLQELEIKAKEKELIEKKKSKSK